MFRQSCFAGLCQLFLEIGFLLATASRTSRHVDAADIDSSRPPHDLAIDVKPWPALLGQRADPSIELARPITFIPIAREARAFARMEESQSINPFTRTSAPRHRPHLSAVRADMGGEVTICTRTYFGAELP